MSQVHTIPDFLAGQVTGQEIEHNVNQPRDVAIKQESKVEHVDADEYYSRLFVNNDVIEKDEWAIECYKDMFYSPRVSPEDFKNLLLIMEKSTGFNDLYIASGNNIHRKKQKKLTPLLPRRITLNEVEDIVEEMFGKSAVTAAKEPGGRFNESYQLWDGGERYRYRTVITSYQEPLGELGMKIVMRKLSTEAPTFDELNVPKLIRDNCLPRQGLVLVVGETGSGKSTLCASIFNHLRYLKNDARVTLTYEQPIEYILSDPDAPNLILQHSVGERGDFKTFYDGLSCALRESPEVIFCGEASTKETFLILPKIAMSGHLGISTLHASSVANTFMRIGDEIDPTYAPGVIRSFVSFTKMIVCQYLAKSINGVVPIQEILIFTPTIVAEILKRPNDELITAIAEAVEKHGQPMKEHAKKLYDTGQIDEVNYLMALSGE